MNAPNDDTVKMSQAEIQAMMYEGNDEHRASEAVEFDVCCGILGEMMDELPDGDYEPTAEDLAEMETWLDGHVDLTEFLES